MSPKRSMNMGLPLALLVGALLTPTLALAECRFEVVGIPGILIKGASQQALKVFPNSDCKVPQSLRLLRLSLASNPPFELKGAVDFMDKALLTLRLDPISRLLPDGFQEWEVQDADGKKLGSLRMLAGELTLKSLAIAYKDPVLDQKQNGRAADDADAKLPIAVVNPLLLSRKDLADPSAHGDIINLARISLPAALPAASQGRSYIWTLHSASWEGDVSFANCRRRDVQNVGDEEERLRFLERSSDEMEGRSHNWWQSSQCDLLRLDAITFDVSRRQVSPLVIEVGLRSPDQNEELLRVPITLAAQARRESIPLPIASLIEASCDRYDIKRYEEDTQIKILQESRATVEDMAAKAAAAKEALSRAQLPVRNLSGEIEFIQLRIAYMKNEMQQKLAELDAAKQVLGQPPDDGRIASLSKEIRTLEMEVNNYSVRLNGLSNKLEEAKKLVQELEPEAVRLTKAAEEATKNAPTRTSEIIKSIERIKWDRVRNGSIRALANDDALRSGFCRLTLDRVSPLIIDPDILRLYGPQTLGVAVTLDGAPVESSTIWDVESPTAEFVLPPPSTEATPEKPYVIRAQVFDLSNRAVYRQGSFDVKREKISTDREYFYEARLRPRGPFGMSRYRVRYFLTVPLDLTAFRFPASRRELRASSDAGHVQVMTLRAGLLGAVEPWNYDSSRPLWKVPVRFMAGMNLVDLNNARVAPSILAGLSITAPLLDAPSQFGTSAAVGVFWETNLRDPQPFKSSHLIITLGLNIFSLFAAK